jgi:hypothetical protein
MPDTILEENHPKSFQQSVVEIGSVVSEEKMFLKLHSPFFSIFSLAAILVENRDHRPQLWMGPCKDHSTTVWLQLVQWFLRRRYLCEFPIGSYVKLSSTVGPSWSKGRTTGQIFGREPSNGYFIKI